MNRPVYFILLAVVFMLWIGFLYDQFGDYLFPPENTSQLKPDTEKNGPVRKYDDDGKLRTLVSYKDGVKDGTSYLYYSDGKTVQLEMTYVKGKRQGIAKKYYSNGKIYAETPYLDDKLHGVRKVFNKSGSIKAEIPYGYGFSGTGLAEYTAQGKKRELPTIKYQVEGNKIVLGTSKRCKDSRFFIGSLVEDQYFDEFQDNVYILPEEDGQFFIPIEMYAPSYLRLQDIICDCTSSFGNPVILKTRIDVHP